MNHFLKALQKKLSNLNQKNKLLFHTKVKSSEIDLSQLAFTGSINTPTEFLNKLLQSTKPIPLCLDVDARDKSANQLSYQLKNITRINDRVLTESGNHSLYLGWPYVEGKLLDGSTVRCPLFFASVNIYKDAGKWYLSRVKDETIKFNETFLLAYSHFNGLKLPEDLFEFDLLDLGKEIDSIKRELYNYLEKTDLNIHFNQDLFTDTLLPIPDLRKEEANQQYQDGKLKLFNRAAFGIFPQNDSYLISDYAKFISKNEFDSPEEYFSTKIQEYRVQQNQEQNTFTVFRTDAAQEDALKQIKNGHSIVVQGPPGSGKSQLICNLISDFSSRGKKVLVLSQKKVALEVIQNRLEQKKIGHFSALVHDFMADRNSVYKHISDQIENVEGYEKQNNNLDTVLLERNFLQVSKQIDQIAEALNELKEALFNDKDFGLSAKELYLKCNINKEPILGQEAAELVFNTLEDFKHEIRINFSNIKSFLAEDHSWNGRKSFHNYTLTDKSELLKRLTDLQNFKAYYHEKSGEILSDFIEMEDAFWVLEKEPVLKDLLNLIKNEKVFYYFKHYLQKPQADLDWLLLNEKRILDCFKDGTEEHLEIAEINQLQEVFNDLHASKHSLIKRVKWLFFNKKRYILKKALVKNQLKWDKEGLKELQRLVDNRLNIEHLHTKLKDCEWLLDVPKKISQEVIEKWFDRQSIAIEAVKTAKELRSLKEHLNIFENSYQATKEKTEALLSLCRKVPLNRSYWQDYLSETQISQLFRDSEKIEQLITSLEDYENIMEWDKFYNNLPLFKKSILQKIIDEYHPANANEMIYHSEQQIFLSWLYILETKFPSLHLFSSPKLAQYTEELNHSIEKKHELSKDILLLKLKEKTYEDLDYNRLNNRVTYRDLKHQVTKKKKIWPLRKLFQEYSDEIFKLVPCWLCSPETVGAVFPSEEIFDLVIFDEASQCYLENGFPGTFRGKQLVICGDGQQLQPTNIYKVRFENDTEEDADLEIDSLLDFSERYLPSVLLTGHYRSRYKELIDFSNKHFYKGKLEFIPSKEDFNTSSSALEYIKVPGYWDKNTNKAEAEKVVELVLAEYGKNNTDIGIVCFNNKQQDLVEDLLIEAFEKKQLPLPTEIFVKNIENVQGDERGTIIFSVAYAPTLAGKFQMNFGLLNQEGGENRLNVAISRAKEKVVVVTSIWPSQLNTEDTLHNGPKLLKQYLAFVQETSEKGFKKELDTDINQLRGRLSQKLQTALSESIELKQVFFADLASLHKQQFDKLLLADDNLFYSDSSVKSIFSYRPLLLERKGWKVKQVYSRNYWKNRGLQLENISSFLNT